jgi:HlyD family secretion protein
VTAWRRRLLLLLAALGLALGVWWALRPAAVPVESAEVTRGPLEITVDEEGETRVRQRFVVAAPATGRLLRITLEEGDVVAAGDLLAQIVPAPLDPRDRAAAEARLEAALAAERGAAARAALAQAALAQAERDIARAEQLHEAGTISEEALERTRLERVRAQREREAARFASSAARYEAEAARAVLMAARAGQPASADEPCAAPGTCIDVRAPVAGAVLRVREESERVVLGGTPLLELGDAASIEIVVDVLSADAVKIRPGATLWVEDWGGDRPLRASVRLVEPSGFTKISALGVEEQRVNVIGDFVDPPDGLGDGYRIEARIVVWEAEEVLRAPSSALFRRGDGWAAFVLDGSVARLRDVAIGARGPFAAEVKGGLVAGERVVLHPSDRLADGVRVAAGAGAGDVRHVVE